ncbi:MAG: hypothetical protein IKN17_00115, partial [Ruminococcus sp.]|nr:hypothetical protein [Ruminococcus sp.]
APVVTEKPETEAPKESGTEPEAPAAEPEEEKEVLFSYHQEGGDFNSETNVSYNIKVADYIEDYSKHYDVYIVVEATKNANGGVGMMLNGSYTKQNERLRTGAEETWVIEDIDPSALSSDLVVALYYMKDDADFTINSVTFVEAGKKLDAALTEEDEEDNDEDEEDNDEDDEDDEDYDEDEEDNDEDYDEDDEDNDEDYDEDDEDNDEDEDDNDEDYDEDDDEDTDDNDEDYDEDEEDWEQYDAEDEGDDGDGENDGAEDPDNEDDTEAIGYSETTGIGEDQSDRVTDLVSNGDTSADKSAQPAANDIEEAVIHASQQADSTAGSNPATGEESHPVRYILMAVSGGYILFSLISLIAQARRRKN